MSYYKITYKELLDISKQYHLEPSWVVKGRRSLVMNILDRMRKGMALGTVWGVDVYIESKKRRILRIQGYGIQDLENQHRSIYDLSYRTDSEILHF